MRVIVIGAGKPLGAEIALQLVSAGHDVLATRRSSFGQDRKLLAAGVEIAELDVRDRIAIREASRGIDAAVVTPLLSVSVPGISELAEAGIARGVAFSSNNVAIDPDAPVYKALADAEEKVLTAAPGWAVLRPTMIYGHAGDKNLSDLLSHTAKWPILPIPGSGEAMQQPVHLKDLACIAASLAAGEDDIQGVLPLGGPQALSQTELVKLACQVTGNRCRPVHMPLGLPKAWVGFGLPAPVTEAQLDRVELDKRPVDPAELPDSLKPKIDLETGLTQLAETLGLIRPRH